MQFYSVRDLRTESRRMWQDLSSGQEVVLTNNGKPSALVVDIPDGEFEETVRALRQARAMVALNSMRNRAVRQGFLSDEAISQCLDEAKQGAEP